MEHTFFCIIIIFYICLNLKCCFLPVFEAIAPKCMKSPWAGDEESNPAPSKVEEAWPALNDRSLVVMVEQLFSHLMKILNICAHVLDDTPPGPAVKVQMHSIESDYNNAINAQHISNFSYFPTILKASLFLLILPARLLYHHWPTLPLSVQSDGRVKRRR